MVTVGFIVEGASDKILIESSSFQTWLADTYQLQVLAPVVDVGGNGNLCSRNVSVFVANLRKTANPARVVVLADLDPELCAPCITKRKEIIGSENIDLVVIARKALESWFLADVAAMRRWTRQSEFYEVLPEQTEGMPWERLKQIGMATIGRGPGRNKIAFAKQFINHHQFSVSRAAQHPNCGSARYFVEKLALL